MHKLSTKEAQEDLKKLIPKKSSEKFDEALKKNSKYFLN